MVAEAFKINGIARADRHLVVDRIKDAVQNYGGWILDFRQFSNISICLNVEIALDRLESLHAGLAGIGLILDPLVQAPGGNQTITSRTAIGTIQVTFIHNEPDLRVEVPAIPG